MQIGPVDKFLKDRDFWHGVDHNSGTAQRAEVTRDQNHKGRTMRPNNLKGQKVWPNIKK